MTLARLTIRSPLGPLTLAEDDGCLASLAWGQAPSDDATALLAATAAQLDAYFYCGLRQFELPLAPAGTHLQRRAWQAMSEIPFGCTLTYGALAHRLGSSARAVGQACASNPIPIIIPCHRLLAATGLGGYSGGAGLASKRFLLELEGATADVQAPLPLS